MEKLLILSEQQGKTQRCSVYYHPWLRKLANIHIREDETSEFLVFLLKKGRKIFN